MAEPIAIIKQGKVKGITGVDLNGETYFRFLGIPYAKPPVGSLRFKAPQPAEPWRGIRDANKEGDSSICRNIIKGAVMGSEDCLYLNVFTKEMPKEGVNPKPVMFCIHGGGFTFGHGKEEIQGAKHLIAEDIVLVSINYRVGVLGFLSSDDLSLEIPGNAGLKDQVLAMKWVQENIAAFNGDPNNVTIFGSSAGGAAVDFQIISSSAKGLFHKASVQSGGALNTWAWGQKNVIQVAEKLGKKVSNDREALDILMAASAEELFEASQQFTDELFNANVRRPFGPVIEKPNPTAFLTEDPIELLKSGTFNQVPTIYGVCSSEGLGFGFRREELSKHVDLKEIAAFWSLGEDREKQENIKSLINEFYFKDGETPEASFKITGDICFNIGVIESAKLAAKTSRSPVYLYIFDYKNSLTDIIAKFLNIDTKYNEVTHGGEMVFLFECTVFTGGHAPNKDEIEDIKKVTKIWGDFARTGIPHENWRPVTDVNKLNYFRITENPKLEERPFGDRMAIWEKVFKEIATIDVRVQEKASS